MAATTGTTFTAANYLGIQSLFEVGLKTIANMVRGKPSSQVRDMLTISYGPPGQRFNATEDA